MSNSKSSRERVEKLRELREEKQVMTKTQRMKDNATILLKSELTTCGFCEDRWGNLKKVYKGTPYRIKFKPNVIRFEKKVHHGNNIQDDWLRLRSFKYSEVDKDTIDMLLFSLV